MTDGILSVDSSRKKDGERDSWTFGPESMAETLLATQSRVYRVDIPL